MVTAIKTRLRVAADGTLTGQVMGLPPGEREVELC